MSTPDGSLSHQYNLGVVVPRAYILGSEEYYAQTGTVISLVCIIEDVSIPGYLQNIFSFLTMIVYIKIPYVTALF